MQLYPFFQGIVYNLYLFHCGNGPGTQYVFPVVLIIFQATPGQNGHALFQLVQLFALAGVLYHL